MFNILFYRILPTVLRHCKGILLVTGKWEASEVHCVVHQINFSQPVLYDSGALSCWTQPFEDGDSDADFHYSAWLWHSNHEKLVLRVPVCAKKIFHTS